MVGVVMIQEYVLVLLMLVDIITVNGPAAPKGTALMCLLTHLTVDRVGMHVVMG